MRTPKQIWELKTGRRTRPENTSLHSEVGWELEAKTRAAYEVFTGEHLEPPCLVYDRFTIKCLVEPRQNSGDG
jgi:hypothetical protein